MRPRYKVMFYQDGVFLSESAPTNRITAHVYSFLWNLAMGYPYHSDVEEDLND